MKKQYRQMRVYKETGERLKVKAAKKKTSVIKIIDDFSKEPIK